MEMNQKTNFETVKNEHYQAMLSHLDGALQNWNNFSRLDRFEYAYKSLELAKNYVCSVRGVAPEKISTALEVMPYFGYCHSVKTANDSTRVVTTLSIPQLLSAFKAPPEMIMKASLHEMTHACDEILLNTGHFENAPPAEFSPGNEFFHPGYYHEISQNYNNFGIAWLGNVNEIRADEVGNIVTIDLLQDLASYHQDNSFYQLRADGFRNFAERQIAREYAAEVELKEWKAELYKKYLPEGETSYPIIDDSITFGEIEQPTHSFVSIEKLRSVANQNEELFKTPGFVVSELQGLSTTKELSAYPEIDKQFTQTNSECVSEVDRVIIPITTMDFLSCSLAMEMN